MGRNLDLDNCTNKQAAVIAAYVEELEENERKICDEGAWAISLDLSRITFWYPDFDAILSEPSTYSKPETGARALQKAERSG